MGNIIEYWRVVNDPVFNGYRILSDCPAQFLPDTKKYQMHVYNNLYDYLEGRAELYCDAQSMGRTIDIYQLIKKELKMPERLAMMGGKPIIESPFQSYNSIGEEEIQAVIDVMKAVFYRSI